jgi:hypothetical protein
MPITIVSIYEEGGVIQEITVNNPELVTIIVVSRDSGSLHINYDREPDRQPKEDILKNMFEGVQEMLNSSLGEFKFIMSGDTILSSSDEEKQMPITEKQKQEYLRVGSLCPYCRNGNIEGSSIDYEGNQMFQNVTCTECGKRWIDVYTLNDITEIEEK